MSSLDGESQADQQKVIRQSDIVAFLGGEDVDPSLATQISLQMKSPGSPVHQWVSELSDKLARPFDVDSSKIAADETPECTEEDLLNPPAQDPFLRASKK